MLKDSTAEAPAPLPMCSENDCCEYRETLRESFNQAENAKISVDGVEYNAGQIAALVEGFWIEAGGFNCQSQCQAISLINILYAKDESQIEIPNKYQFEDMAEALGCWIQDQEWGHDWSNCFSSLVITPTEDAIVPEDKEGMLYQISIKESEISTEWVTSTVEKWLQDCQSALPEDRNAHKEYIPNQESLSGTSPQNRSSVD